ncbi:MAG: GNAT family N-acetyltransferase [Patescibacteria group bacterium]
MHITTRPYDQSDRDAVVLCLEALSDYLSPLDPLKKIRRLPPWGKKYMGWLLNKVKRQRGIIFVAQADDRVIGCIVVVVEKMKKLDQLSFAVSHLGRVQELFVYEKHRRHGVASLLMDKAENYLREKKCEIVRIEVFEPNTHAHNFYQSLGYTDRIRDMTKQI